MDNEIATHIVRLNCQAMNMLDRPKHAGRLLHQAESLLESDTLGVRSLKNRENLLAITCNNLACYYKSVKQPNVSLNYLIKALNIEVQTSAQPADLAGTYLNLSAIYSKLNKHKQAVFSCFTAIQYLKMYENEGEIEEHILSSLVVAYYNLGVEHEILRQYEKALKFYQQGLTLAEEGLGPTHTLTRKLSQSLTQLRNHSNSLNSFIHNRRSLREQGRVASSSLGPISTLKMPENIVKDSKLPSLYDKAKRNLSIDLSEYKETENRLAGINEFSGPRFSNAIDRLKNLLIN